MKNLIYISGPITDNKTGQPREGWQERFRAAEEKLRGMGFEVINPIDIAPKAEKYWNVLVETRQSMKLTACDYIPPTPRWLYIERCIDELSNHCRAISLFSDPLKAVANGRLLGLYVIGDIHDLPFSYGTMCEINFALAAGLPVWSEYFDGEQMDNMFWVRPGLTLAETASALDAEVKSKKIHEE